MDSFFIRESLHFPDLASMGAIKAVNPGFIAWADGFGRYTAVPAGTFGIPDGLHVVAGQNGVQWADESKFAAVGGSVPLLSPEQVIIGSGGGNVARQLTFDDIAPAFGITAFTLSGTNVAPVVEVGATLSSISASAAYTSIPGSGNITDTTSGVWTFNSPFFSGTRAGTVHKTALNDSWTATLNVTGATNKTSTYIVSWQARIYHGPSVAGVYSAAFITALANNNLQAFRATTFTDNAGVNQLLFYAFPTAYGTPSFNIGGFTYPGTKLGSAIPVTNANSVVINYDLWVPVLTTGLGLTTVTVS
jgi:hypothetical protein